MALTTTQKFRVGLWAATLLAFLTAAIAFRDIGALTQRTAWVSESSEVLYELEALQSRLKDAETGQRGFLLTGNRKYLEPYVRGRPGVTLHLTRLDSLLGADTAQVAALRSLRPLVGAKLAELGATIALDTTVGSEAAARLVNSGKGKAVMDSIRAIVVGMMDRERGRLAGRVAAKRQTAVISEGVVLFFLALTGVLFAVGRGVIRRDDRQRTQAIAQILQLRDQATATAAEMRELAERAAEEAARSEEETARAEDEAARAEEFAAQADEARERLEAVLAGISDGFLVMDHDLTVLYVNEQAAAMLGRSPAGLLQQPLWSSVPEGRDGEFDEAFRRAVVGREIVRFEARLSGTDRWLAANVYPGGGNLSVFLQDVTERREAQARAREGDERLRVALDAGRFGVWEWDISAGRVAWSDRTHSLHGIPVGSFGGRLEDFVRMVHPDDVGKVNEQIQTAIREGTPYEAEFRVVHPDGTVHWLATAGRGMYDTEGKPQRMLGVTWERTEQRLAEESARHGQRMEAIGRLAGGIAHEVNNQMSVVLGFAQFILKRPDIPTDVRADVTEIHRAGERSASITSQLLAFSRRQLLRPEALDLSAVVASFERVLKRTVGERCELALDLARELPAIEADRGQLEQILLNLALNAADAMPGVGTLRLATSLVEMPRDAGALGARVVVARGHYVRLEVSDTGQGMEPATLRHMFEPFFTTKPVGKGTGLGLSTVYGIVKQSGGYVWVDSTPGAGTSVHLFFPAAAGLAPAPPAAPGPRSTPARGLVMVVEDEPAVRAMVSRILEHEGYDVIAAQHGREALEVLDRGNGVRLVVSDVAMPVMGGRELGDSLARLRPELPVLYMSGYADDEIVARGLLEAGQPFIQKPFPAELFVRRVAELLQLRRR